MKPTVCFRIDVCVECNSAFNVLNLQAGLGVLCWVLDASPRHLHSSTLRILCCVYPTIPIPTLTPPTIRTRTRNPFTFAFSCCVDGLRYGHPVRVSTSLETMAPKLWRISFSSRTRLHCGSFG